MTGLLTTDEYTAIAKGLTFPTQAFINGAFRPAQSGRMFDTLNPATGKGSTLFSLPTTDMPPCCAMSRLTASQMASSSTPTQMILWQS